ncbi:MAG TPA: efflux RND transporter periplasmic adaptor subunit [Kiloniellaceae bacterium]|nr:efflux RND transporter periplasmic adaptor subunit [Kiloniellaceae bacterium]
MEMKDWRRLADDSRGAPAERDIAQILEVETGRAAARRPRWVRLAAVALAAVLAAAAAWYLFAAQPEARYATVEAARGELRVTVTATGRLEAVNQVEVGSELSGIVATVDADFNNRVVAGQVLATLDSDTLEAEVMRSRAALEAARARVLQSEATVTETQKALARTRTLVAETWRSETDLDSAQAAYDRAVASLALAKAEVSEAEAQLQSDATKLSKAVIRAPMDGIVLERKVEPGQTVAATLESPHLFTLAEDLTRMELQVDVDEADTARSRSGSARCSPLTPIRCVPSPPRLPMFALPHKRWTPS